MYIAGYTKDPLLFSASSTDKTPILLKLNNAGPIEWFYSVSKSNSEIVHLVQQSVAPGYILTVFNSPPLSFAFYND